jgi:integrase
MTPILEKTKNGKIAWRVSYTVAKRRVRRTFRTREEAREWIDENSDIATTEGRIFWQAWRGITPIERHELMDSLVLMRSHRISHPKSNMVNAVKILIAKEEAIQTSLLLSDAVERYLATKLNNKRKGSVSQGWYDVLNPCLRLVARDLPKKTLAEFSTDEIEEYLDDQDWSCRTFNNYHAYISSVFAWAIENKFATHNPVAKIEKYAKKFITREVIVPAVPVIKRVLQLARTPKYRHLKSCLDLGFGFAMRSSEISELDWADITKDVVHVSSSVAKGGRARNIGRRPLLEGIFNSLLAEKKQSGKVAPKGWRRDLTQLFIEAGMGKPRNIVRKAGGSYHFHATGNEALPNGVLKVLTNRVSFGPGVT